MFDGGSPAVHLAIMKNSCHIRYYQETNGNIAAN